VSVSVMAGRADAGGVASRASSTSMCREIQRLDIAFKEPMATFKAGDVLAGSIQMDIVQEFKIKGTLLYLYCMHEVRLPVAHYLSTTELASRMAFRGNERCMN